MTVFGCETKKGEQIHRSGFDISHSLILCIYLLRLLHEEFRSHDCLFVNPKVVGIHKSCHSFKIVRAITGFFSPSTFQAPHGTEIQIEKYVAHNISVKNVSKQNDQGVSQII